jgi:hypothetical protein
MNCPHNDETPAVRFRYRFPLSARPSGRPWHYGPRRCGLCGHRTPENGKPPTQTRRLALTRPWVILTELPGRALARFVAQPTLEEVLAEALYRVLRHDEATERLAERMTEANRQGLSLAEYEDLS